MSDDSDQRPSLLSQYLRPPQTFDECLDENGQVRPHWQRLLAWMGEVGPSELGRQEQLAHLRISEDGVAYHVHDDPVRAARPWPLDIVPLILSQQEWAGMETGLAQRARVLDELLMDLHGAQRSIQEGVIPPELVYGVPYFLHACRDAQAERRSMLHLYACDMIRTAGGQWNVLADRTQAPAGIGFALENRVVSARLLSEPFLGDRVQRLAYFFRTVREAMAGLDPRRQGNPRVVLLTPGPGNETYFENAYLAHYLGYTLVEAEDLTVREDGVHLKMLGGLKRVDVILRRIDDAFCDPVELRSDSMVGVPGLVRAVRNQQVGMANALGTGLMATPALMSFLPAACRYFFGEDLLLPSMPGGWCGDAVLRKRVLDDPEAFAVYDVAGAQPNQPEIISGKTKKEKDEFKKRVEHRPDRFVVQEIAPLATLPELDKNQVRPCHAILRTFLVNHGGTFVTMPGGLARVAGRDFWGDLAVYRGRASKDTWVMSDEPVDKFSLLMPSSVPVAVSRGGGDIPSRVAEHLFWLGRYKERLESSVRILRVVLIRLLEQGDDAASPGLEALRRMVQFYPLQGLADAPVSSWPALILDPKNQGSIGSLLDMIQRNSSRVRDRFSGDTWRILNRLFVDIPALHPVEWRMLQRMIDWFNVSIIRLSALDGMTMESMTRGPGWRFLDMGRRLERALHMISMLQISFVEGADRPLEASWCEDVLSVADNLITYRRRYLTQLQLAPLLDLLLADESNPRSVAHQLERLGGHVRSIVDASQKMADQEEQVLLALVSEVRQADLLAMSDAVIAQRRPALGELLERLKTTLPELSNALTSRYFSHSEPSRPLAALASFASP